MAPPPGTIEAALEALLTTIIASFIDLSASSINCSAPPLITIVAVLEFGQFWKRLNLSAPICFSSNIPQVPNAFSDISLQVCNKLAPVAFETLSISSAGTLPAQNKFLSAKY